MRRMANILFLIIMINSALMCQKEINSHQQFDCKNSCTVYTRHSRLKNVHEKLYQKHYSNLRIVVYILFINKKVPFSAKTNSDNVLQILLHNSPNLYDRTKIPKSFYECNYKGSNQLLILFHTYVWIHILSDMKFFNDLLSNMSNPHKIFIPLCDRHGETVPPPSPCARRQHQQ